MESESEKVVQLCPTLCDPVNYTVPGILQARVLEWVAFPFSRESSQPRDQTQVSCIAGGFFTNWAIREDHQSLGGGANGEILLNLYKVSILQEQKGSRDG